MIKTLLALSLGAFSSLSAVAAGNPTTPTLLCEPPLLQVPADPAVGEAQYQVACGGHDAAALAPNVRFSGALTTRGTPPYDVRATYIINVQSAHARTLGQEPREDQEATGALSTSTQSVAALPSQFAAQSVWDATSGALSIEERAGQWRVFSVNYAETADEAGVLEAGTATSPVRNGRASAKMVLGSKYSRFAGKAGAALPVVLAELAMRDGKLELQIGETRVANQAALQGALVLLDKQPKDIARAWALGARAQFLGLDAEVRYAEQKVAAHHPDLLAEFQHAVARIKPHSAQQ